MVKGRRKQGYLAPNSDLTIATASPAKSVPGILEAVSGGWNSLQQWGVAHYGRRGCHYVETKTKFFKHTLLHALIANWA